MTAMPIGQNDYSGVAGWVSEGSKHVSRRNDGRGLVWSGWGFRVEGLARWICRGREGKGGGKLRTSRMRMQDGFPLSEARSVGGKSGAGTHTRWRARLVARINYYGDTWGGRGRPLTPASWSCTRQHIIGFLYSGTCAPTAFCVSSRHLLCVWAKHDPVPSTSSRGQA